MVIERVPKLNIRPKHLVKVYASNTKEPIPLLRETDLTFDNISKYLGSDRLVQIGTIQSITITSERGTGFYRNLDYTNLGKIRETYPHLPNYSASVRNVAFYSQHLLNAFQATVQGDVFTKSPGETDDKSIVPTFNIYNQIAPLIIKVDMLEPANDASTIDKSKSIILWDCWFGNSEIEFSVEEDIFLVQEAEIKFAWLIPQS